MASSKANAKAAEKIAQEKQILHDLDKTSSNDRRFEEIAVKYGVAVSKVIDIEKKAKAAEFEASILRFMEKLGFEDVKGTTTSTIRGMKHYSPLSFKTKKDSIQIDAIGRIGKTLFIIECKQTENFDGNYSGLEQEIHKHDRRIDLFEKQLFGDKPFKENAEIFSSTKWKDCELVVGVFALDNIKIGKKSTNDVALKKYKFEKWDNNFIDYYTDLESKIGKYAQYDMLGDMKIENDDDEPIATWALKTEIKNLKTKKITQYYQFLIDPRKLLKIATVARRERPGERFYQRQLIAPKLNSIRKFLTDGNLSPNNIVVGFDPKIWKSMGPNGGFSSIDINKCQIPIKSRANQLLNEEKKERKKDPGIVNVEFGTLTFPRKYRSCWVIDGQHRLYGMAKIERGRGKKPSKEKISDIKLPIIAFSNLEHEDMANMFLDINTNQKPIEANLKFDLFGEYSPNKPDGLASTITKKLNTSSNSPLKGRIYYPSLGIGIVDKNEKIGIAAFCEALKDSKLMKHSLYGKHENPCVPKEEPPTDSIKHADWRNATERNVVKLVSDFYSVFEEEYPNELELDSKGFLYNPQTSKLLLPFLAQILVHKGQKADKRILKKYVKGLKNFMSAMDSESVRKSINDSASRRSLASDVQKQMCNSVKESNSSLSRFGFDLIGNIEKSWEKLFEKFGGFFEQYEDWEKNLTPSMKNEIKKKKREKGIEDGKEHELIDMNMIAHLLDEDREYLSELLNDLKKTPAFDGMQVNKIKRDVIEDISDLKEEYSKIIVGDPYPQVAGIKNKTKRETLILALSQIDTGNDDDD